MNVQRAALALFLACTIVAAARPLQAQIKPEPYKPTVGQPGKDAVWVPTPPALVEKMLDMVHVTPADFVVDLGSGDGRNVIAAARRGARALGVEFNPDLVALSKRTAAEAGVADKATFVEGDMYAADISRATVLALFLLTDNMDKMVSKFLALKPGSRIVANTFGITGWSPDEKATIEGDCISWCTALVWIVPARVEGTWRLSDGELTLKQDFQMISGTLSADGRTTPIESGKLRGEEITFTVAGVQYTGKVSENRMSGTITSGGTNDKWTARRK
jgi:SAM-dependent methyltransferase